MAVITLTLGPALTVALTLVGGSSALTLDAPATAPASITLVPAAPLVLTAVAELLRGPKGEPGPAGPLYLAAPPIGFSFGDASPRALPAADLAKLVLAVSVNIVTPFDGAAPSLRLGTAAQPELLVAAAQIDLATATEFEFSPNLVLAAAQGLVLTLTPGAGATQGAGWIVIEQISVT